MRFFQSIIPAFTWNQMLPVFCKERTVHSRCHISLPSSQPRSGNVPLPQKGSTRILSLFHGVSMISAAASVSVIGALTGHLTVSSFMQGDTGCIDPNCCNILHRKRHESGNCCSVFREPGDPIDAPAVVLPIAFFMIDWISDGLNRAYFLRSVAFATQNLPSFRDIILPTAIALGLLKQFVKGHCLELCLSLRRIRSAGAEKHICTVQIALCICQKSNFSVFYLRDLISQIQDLSF